MVSMNTITNALPLTVSTQPARNSSIILSTRLNHAMAGELARETHTSHLAS
jgi:hypothetical protein